MSEGGVPVQIPTTWESVKRHLTQLIGRPYDMTPTTVARNDQARAAFVQHVASGGLDLTKTEQRRAFMWGAMAVVESLRATPHPNLAALFDGLCKLTGVEDELRTDQKGAQHG